MRSRIVFLVVSVFVCLLSGWMMGAAMPLPNRAALTPTAAPSPTTVNLLDQPQVSILLLVVESRSAPRAALDGVWVLTLAPNVPKYFLMGFPTDTPVRDGLHLRDYYNAANNLSDACHFVEGALELVSGGLKVQHRVIVDRATLAQLVDELGGIRLDGRTLDGEALMTRYAALPAGDAAAQVRYQEIALRALTDAALAQSWTDARLQQLFAQHRTASTDTEVLLALALQAVRLGSPQFHITTYQPPDTP